MSLKLPFRKLKKFRVLVGTPHNSVKNYCFDEFLVSTTNLTYKHYDILIADNSRDKKNVKQLMKMGIDSVYVKPKNKANQRYIAESHEELRKAALRGKYDYLLHLESDIFPPADIIERLLVHQEAVVSAMYFINEGADSHLMLQDIEQNGSFIRETRNVSNGKDILRVTGKLEEVYSAGLGCCLLHKDVLKQIKFRWEDGAPAHPDSFFSADLNALGIKQYVDTDILCKHDNRSWSTITDYVANAVAEI